jgi:hypothetical protein
MAKPPTLTLPTLPRARTHVERYEDLNKIEARKGGGSFFGIPHCRD